jgi:AcrR family transcriptional regulator
MTDSSSKASSLRRLPKQARSKQRVDRILDAAAEVFLEMGYEAATTHVIAARAETAIGSLYQFFPDKFAIFQALELRHIEQGRALGAVLFTPAMAQLPLEEFVKQMVKQCVQFFEHPAPRAIFLQYFANPSLFRHIDNSFTQEFVKQLSGVLSLMNPALSTDTCHLLADVCMQCFNPLMLTALQSDHPYRQQLLSQTQDLLVAYLRPHVEPKTTKS